MFLFFVVDVFDVVVVLFFVVVVFSCLFVICIAFVWLFY